MGDINNTHYIPADYNGDVEIGETSYNDDKDKDALNEKADREIDKRKIRIKLIISATRLFLAITIIIVVSVIGSTSYKLLRSIEEKSFQDQYTSIHDVVSIRVNKDFTDLIGTSLTLANRYTTEFSSFQASQYLIDQTAFESQYAQLGQLSVARALSFNPMIVPGSSSAWESWAANEITSSSNSYDDGNKVNNQIKIFKKVNGVVLATSQNSDCSSDPNHNVYFPVWQIAPISSNTKAIMFDLHSEYNRCKALNDVIDSLDTAVTDIIQLVQDGTLTRPSSIIFQPVIINGQLKGTTSVVFSWDSFFQDMIPNSIDSLYLVLTSPSQTFTWEITNGRIKLLGKGYLHDKKFDKYMKVIEIEHIGSMDFDLYIYPSKKYTESFYTTQPQQFTIAIVLVIALIAFFFIVLDYLNYKNSNKLEQEINFKGGIIDQLFPSNVQKKLFRRRSVSSPHKHKSNNGCFECVNRKSSLDHSSRLSSFLNISNHKQEQEILFDNPEPIADYYESATVLFADLVGFTNWSSNKSPNDVFRLLEGLFRSFDHYARLRGVFKVETIGDCYMAVTSIPNRTENHADTMADFALDIMSAIEKMNKTRLMNGELSLIHI